MRFRYQQISFKWQKYMTPGLPERVSTSMPTREGKFPHERVPVESLNVNHFTHCLACIKYHTSISRNHSSSFSGFGGSAAVAFPLDHI